LIPVKVKGHHLYHLITLSTDLDWGINLDVLKLFFVSVHYTSLTNCSALLHLDMNKKKCFILQIAVILSSRIVKNNKKLGVQADLVICGLFICEFAHMRLWNKPKFVICDVFCYLPPIMRFFQIKNQIFNEKVCFK